MPRKVKPRASSPPLDRATFCTMASALAGELWDSITAIVGATIKGANRAVLELTTAEVIKAFEPAIVELVEPAPPIAKRRARPPKSATATSSPTTSPRAPAPPAPRRAPRVQELPPATRLPRPRAAPSRIKIEPDPKPWLDEDDRDLSTHPDNAPDEEPIARKPRKPSGRAPALGMRSSAAIRASIAPRAGDPPPFEPDVDPDGPTITTPTVAELEANKPIGATLPVPRASFSVSGRL